MKLVSILAAMVLASNFAFAADEPAKTEGTPAATSAPAAEMKAAGGEKKHDMGMGKMHAEGKKKKHPKKEK
jgi:hypothetical protein